MKFSQESAAVMLRNSPFWYMDGWFTLCHFIIDPAAAGDTKGVFNRGVSAWGYETRYVLGEDGVFSNEEELTAT